MVRVLAALAVSALATAFFTFNSGSASPTGAASGDLGGSYPSPTVTSVADVTTGTLGVANGGTGRATLTNHGVVCGAAAGAVNVTAAGTAGQVLTSNGAGADPTFQAAAAGGVSLQGSSPGVADTGNFNVSGNGIVGAKFSAGFGTPTDPVDIKGGGANASWGTTPRQILIQDSLGHRELELAGLSGGTSVLIGGGSPSWAIGLEAGTGNTGVMFADGAFFHFESRQNASVGDQIGTGLMTIQATSGNVEIGTGTTGTDSGFRLLVSGTTKLNGVVVAASSLNVGTCTLNGGTPATCTATVRAASQCAVSVQSGSVTTTVVDQSVSGTTLTVTGTAAATNVVSYVCFAAS